MIKTRSKPYVRHVCSFWFMYFTREHSFPVVWARDWNFARKTSRNPHRMFVDQHTAHWYSEGNFLRNPLQYRHASSFDKITALSRGLSYRKSFVAIIYDNNFTKPHKKIRRIYFARINRTIASYRRNGVRLHRTIAFELSQLDIRRFVYVKLRSATRHFCDTASPVSIVIHDKQSAEYKVE